MLAAVFGKIAICSSLRASPSELLWIYRTKLKSGRLVPTHHQVQILYRLTGSTFDNIIRHSNNRDPSSPLIHRKSDIAIIRAKYFLRCRPLARFTDPYEWSSSVKFAIQRYKSFFCIIPLQFCIHCAHNSSCHRHQMRCKGHRYRITSSEGQLLFYFSYNFV